MNLPIADGNLAWRILVCHKHPVSARLHFLVPEQNGVLLPSALPALSVFSEEDRGPAVQSHPAAALKTLCAEIPFPKPLELVPEYQVYMETPGCLLTVYLAALPGHDLCTPPAGTRWIQLPQSIGMPWLDRELLRRAYEVLLG